MADNARENPAFDPKSYRQSYRQLPGAEGRDMVPLMDWLLNMKAEDVDPVWVAAIILVVLAINLWVSQKIRRRLDR